MVYYLADLEWVDDLIKNGSDVNSRVSDENSETVLMVAVINGNIRDVYVSINCKLNPPNDLFDK